MNSFHHFDEFGVEIALALPSVMIMRATLVSLTYPQAKGGYPARAD